MLSSENARFRRVFAGLLGLCRDQPWLGQSSTVCTCVACRNVCSARSKGDRAVSGLGGDNVDGELGVAWLCFCTLRDVETPPRSDYEFKSARSKIATRKADLTASNSNFRYTPKSDMPTSFTVAASRWPKLRRRRSRASERRALALNGVAIITSSGPGTRTRRGDLRSGRQSRRRRQIPPCPSVRTDATAATLQAIVASATGKQQQAATPFGRHPLDDGNHVPGLIAARRARLVASVASKPSALIRSTLSASNRRTLKLGGESQPPKTSTASTGVA
jgi:hypothetical protein